MGSLRIKVVFLCIWFVVNVSTVPMLQHPTSSQSIVFHSQKTAGSPLVPGSAAGTDQYANALAKYDFKYEVSDPQTGDRKSHWESRDGDRVRGAYTIYEPDGALRTVEYTADSLHGFNAVVRRDEPKHGSLGSYNPSSNSVHAGYDNPSSKPRYSVQRAPYSSLGTGRSESTGYSPGVGYTVDHAVVPRIEPIKPY